MKSNRRRTRRPRASANKRKLRHDVLAPATTLELVDFEIVPQPKRSPTIPTTPVMIPRHLAPSYPAWARTMLAIRGLGSPYISPRLVAALLDEQDIERALPTIFEGHYARRVEDAWQTYRGHRYVDLEVVYELLDERRAAGLEQLLVSAVEELFPNVRPRRPDREQQSAATYLGRELLVSVKRAVRIG